MKHFTLALGIFSMFADAADHRVAVERAVEVQTLSNMFPCLPPLIKRDLGSHNVARWRKSATNQEEVARNVMLELFRTYPKAVNRQALGFLANDGKDLKDALLSEAYARFSCTQLIDPDPRVELFWQLRLTTVQASPQLTKEITVGQSYLLVMNVNDLDHSPHSALGFWTVGANPQNDFVLNPSSLNQVQRCEKTPSRFKQLTGQVPLDLQTVNLWGYLDSEREHRNVTVNAKLIPVSPAQKTAMQALAGLNHHAKWGPYNLLRRNCAYATMDILNSLVPLDAELSGVGFMYHPQEVLDKADSSFPVSAKLNIPVKPHADDFVSKRMPAVAYSGQSIDQLSETFKIFKLLAASGSSISK